MNKSIAAMFVGMTLCAALPALADEDPSFSGRAHWYGKELHGNRTASGAIFDRHKLTAAHPTIPLGTKVKVRSKYTGKEVVILVNDRCPKSSQRCIDLSEGAAKAIGIWPHKPSGIEGWILTKAEAAELESAPKVATQQVKKKSVAKPVETAKPTEPTKSNDSTSE